KVLLKFVPRVLVGPPDKAGQATHRQTQAMLPERDKVKSSQTKLAVMDFPVEQIAPQDLDAVPQRSIFGAASTKMRGSGLRHVHQLPTAISKSFGPIHILGIEEKTLIQTPHLVNGLAASQPEATAEQFHLRAARLWGIPHSKSREPGPVWQYVFERQHSIKEIQGGGESPAGALQVAIRPANLGTGQPHPRIVL